MIKNNKQVISFLFFLSGLLLIFIANSLYDDLKLEDSFSIQEVIGNEVVIGSNSEIKFNLSFIGDSMLASYKGTNTHGSFQDLLERHDYTYPFNKVKDIFFKDDFTIANGENVFTDRNLTPVNKNHNPAYWYYTRSRFANVYKESSIEVVSVMNNHSYDYGNEGYKDTVSALKDADVLVGEEEPLILEKNGFKVGLVCTNLFHEFQANQVNQKILKLKEEVDYIIIYFHGGEEYLHYPTESIKKYSRSFIDSGANLVIGLHPHVLQPIEIYQDKTIVYSLGNFIFGGSSNLENRTIIYQLELNIDVLTKKYKQKTNIIPCYLYSSKIGYEKWLPSVIENDLEKQKVIDFMNGKVDSPI